MMERRQLRIGASYLPLLQDRIRDKFVLIEGRRGTAKTSSILKILMRRAVRYPGSRWLLARSTRERLSESVLTTFDKQVLPEFNLPIPIATPQHRSGYTLPNGSHFIFLALDDPQRSQSLEIDGGDVSEGVEIGTPDRVTSLAGAMRFHGVEVPYRQMFIDCNPGNPAHWLNKQGQAAGDHLRRIKTPADYKATLKFNESPCEDGKIKRIITCMADNPGYFDTEKWELTKNGQEYIDGLGYLTPHIKKRWLEGLWVAPEGGVFPEFDVETHVVDDFEPPHDWKQCIGLDPGFDHPCACLFFAMAPDGGIYIYDEHYRNGWTIAKHCTEIKGRIADRELNILRMYADPQQFWDKTATGSCDKQARDCDMRFTPWPRTATSGAQGMVESVRQLLVNTGKAKPPYLKVCRRCVSTIEEFQTWSYKRTSNGDLPNGDDAYVDSSNHAMDVIKGVISSGFFR